MVGWSHSTSLCSSSWCQDDCEIIDQIQGWCQCWR